MKILSLLSSSSVTGPAELCLEDARQLRAAGHQVLFGCDTRRSGNYVQAIRDAGFELMKELTLCPKPTASEVLRDLKLLRERVGDADLVHCRFAHDHTLAMLAMRGMVDRPALVRTAEIARSLRPGWLRGVGFRACDAVVVSCQDYARRLEHDHRVPDSRIHILPGRVDGRRFSPSDRGLRQEFGVAGDQVLFGIVSRIKIERRHETIVRGFASIAHENPQARLAIVGRGEHEPAIRQLVEQLGLAQRVIFAGYRTGDELVAAYRAFDVALWLAEGNDGTCRAVLESMACGVPTLTAREGAMAELVRDGEDGLVVEPTEGAVAAGMVRLLEPSLRTGMKRSARERALRFGPDRRGQGLLSIYEAAVAERKVREALQP